MTEIGMLGRKPRGNSGAPRVPDLRQIATTAYHDWFGKDVQETPTVSYVWTADQFGHFGLGFQITFLLGWIAAWAGYSTSTTLATMAGVNIAVWVIKEAFDYLRERKKAAAATSEFPFNGMEILWNIVTALFYIAAGAVVAGAAAFYPWRPIVVFLVLLVPAILIGIWWLRRKITFQQAGLPYLYRLANFPTPIGDATAVRYIQALYDPKTPDPMHLIISGPIGAGKTCLAVGIGTEFAFRLGIGRYTTLAKLVDILSDTPSAPDASTEFNDGRVLWPWDRSQLLIIDDVDTVLRRLAPAEEDELNAFTTHVSRRLPMTLKDRRTVWVLSDVSDLDKWRDAIGRALRLNEEGRAITTIPLTTTVKAALAAKAASRGK
jgi:hypothetical protein